MTSRTIIGIASVAVAAGLVLAGPAFADGRRDDGDERPRLRTVLPKRVPPPHRGLHHFGPPPFGPHPFFRGPVVRFGVVVPPPPAFAPPPFYAVPSPSYDPRMYGQPPMYSPSIGSIPEGTVSIAPPTPPTPPPPPTPNVIEYPHGRYELHGDGVTAPYRWVWIPNPPPGPPPDAPVAPGPAGKIELYRWTDTQGVVHWTDRWDAVPEQHRDQVTKPNS